MQKSLFRTYGMFMFFILIFASQQSQCVELFKVINETNSAGLFRFKHPIDFKLKRTREYGKIDRMRYPDEIILKINAYIVRTNVGILNRHLLCLATEDGMATRSTITPLRNTNVLDRIADLDTVGISQIESILGPPQYSHFAYVSGMAAREYFWSFFLIKGESSLSIVRLIIVVNQKDHEKLHSGAIYLVEYGNDKIELVVPPK